MKRILTLAACCVLALCACSCSQAGPGSLSAEEAKNWTMYLVPLPKSVEITGKTTLAARDVAIAPPDEPDYLVKQAVKELNQAMGLDESAQCPEKPEFTITLRLKGEEAEELGSRKNWEQAYRIVPARYGNGLRLVALTSRGLYYAAKTLQQLIAARKAGSSVDMPILRVTDWPDMEARGLWGCDTYKHLRWMADRKMNLEEQISRLNIDSSGKGSAEPKYQEIVTEGPYYGVQTVPVVLHLEQTGGKGVFARYPNLRATGGEEGAICYSQPQMVDVIAEWIKALGKWPFVTEVDVWLSENLHGKGGCRCAECSKIDRDVLEARTVVAAWRKARKELPRIGLKVSTSEETEDGNAKFIPELPKGVKVSYYHSLLTYNTSHDPMIRPYLAEFAKQGRWIGVAPSLSAIVNFPQPFTSPQFAHARMNEFVQKGLSGLLGYPSPCTLYYRFNIEGAAEWSWNAKGRTPSEFAYSWAVRQGLKDPAEFAEWADLIGAVEWDMYGSDWPSGTVKRNPPPIAQRLKEGTLGELGEAWHGSYRIPFGDVETPAQLDKDVADAAKGVDLARRMGIDEFIYESLIAQGYVQSMKALWELKQLVKDGKIADSDRAAAQQSLKTFVGSLRQSADALPKWEAAVARQKDSGRHTDKPVAAILKLISDVRQAAGDMGVLDDQDQRSEIGLSRPFDLLTFRAFDR